ncbi:class II aldolase/adducin family protein [Methanonatronarchaeum sp. AMET6-2]|uniref:class II aldolase/adducin family protein n=1 Tax=Methanonatronarchaeum sp. AMET6-2 TaxID=2933293 RepID=UPI001FF38B60|nr:class II aldolase/adducin family protein [Methanonatronarchaeum sp. AMET6-2]UOY10199.1 class II aldolase/adducin family protein [Methanonatronarchaeum sp. AMET6-2]
MKVLSKLIETPRRMDQSTFFPGLSGNISYFDGYLLLVTISGADMSNLSESDFVFLNCTENHFQLKQRGGGPDPSSESLLHINSYLKTGPGVILHSHPTYSVILSKKEVSLEMESEGARELVGERINVLSRAEAGSEKLAEKVSNRLKESGVALVENHGLFVKADSFKRARAITEEVERACKKNIVNSIIDG